MGAYIKENWLFVVVAVYLVSMVLYGHYRGFVRLAVSAVSLVLSLGVVHFGAPSVANLLRSNEVVYQAVEDSVTKFIQKDDEAEMRQLTRRRHPYSAVLLKKWSFRNS